MKYDECVGACYCKQRAQRRLLRVAFDSSKEEKFVFVGKVCEARGTASAPYQGHARHVRDR